MAQFFVNQLDFILFFYGLAFILLGAVCIAVSRGENGIIAWAILGIFGYLHGTSEWLDLSALIFGDSPTFALVRTGVMTISFMALFEFGRREAERLWAGIPGPWIQGPLFLLPIVGWYLVGSGGANVMARYAFGLSGAILTSFVLFADGRTLSPGERRWLRVAAGCFLIYGFAAGGVVPNVPHWSGDLFNQDDFARLTHAPVQLVRGLLACAVALSVWIYWGQRLIVNVDSAQYSRFQRRQFVWTIASMVAILVGGWMLTEYLGDVYKRNVEQESAADLNLIISRLSEETVAVDSMVKALAGSHSVAAVVAGDSAARQRAEAALRLDTDSSGAMAGYVFNASGKVVLSTEAGDRVKPADYRSFPYFVKAAAGQAGSYFATDYPSQFARYFASYPIRDRTGVVVGVAVLEKSLETSVSDLRHFDRAFALVDADGVVLITNRPAMQFRALWPLAPQAAGRLRGKYGALNDVPALKNEIVGASWMTFDGKRAFVERHSLTHNDWSLVTWREPQGIVASRILGIIITLQMAVVALVYLVGRERWIYDRIQLERRLELEERARMLDFRATTDALTGLFNRSKFDRLLATETLRADRYKTALSLILYDVDHFKRINDTYGHQTGDSTLVQLSRLVATRVRNSDVLARWGGEEFVILCPNTNGAMASQLARKLRDAIAKNTIEGVGAITCSFGVAEFEQGDTPETLLARADEALYRAKLGGRNTIELATRALPSRQPIEQAG